MKLFITLTFQPNGMENNYIYVKKKVNDFIDDMREILAVTVEFNEIFISSSERYYVVLIANASDSLTFKEIKDCWKNGYLLIQKIDVFETGIVLNHLKKKRNRTVQSDFPIRNQ